MDLTDRKDANADSTDDWDKYINAEYSQLKGFKKETFKNEKLGQLALTYIKGLEETKKLTGYVESNNDKFWSKYTPIAEERVITLKSINSIKKLTFEDSSDKKTFKGLLSDADTVIAIRNLEKETKFKKTKNEYDYVTYTATVMNTTDTDFSYFCYNINLYDGSDTVIDTQSASTDNWDSGTKHVFSFETDAKFKKLEIHDVTYDLD